MQTCFVLVVCCEFSWLLNNGDSLRFPFQIVSSFAFRVWICFEFAVTGWTVFHVGMNSWRFSGWINFTGNQIDSTILHNVIASLFNVKSFQYHRNFEKKNVPRFNWILKPFFFQIILRNYIHIYMYMDTGNKN